ncbi:DNA-binding protein [Agrobacterium tumefaciens]|uniref:DNA-binding protein n=1 Tax=Agrobacterium tumefaciens TaxID=358 RepID=UPI001572A116|nr:DNA-binding protein [Agrobacterium tumefaciens]NSX90381.1 DNA-binding protein [Agrobacterium tumefaciens]
MKQLDLPNLDRWRLDALLDPPARIIWTLPAIAQRIGVCPDFVAHVLAEMPGTPIKKINRRHCVIEKDLIEFFRNLPS